MEKKNIKVIDCKVEVKKKNELSKLADIFFKEDLISVKDHILKEVIFPSIKKALAESGKTAIDMIFYGETRSSSKRYSNRYKTYDDYYNANENTVVTSDRKNNFSGYVYSCDDIIFKSRTAAEDVLSELLNIIAGYNLVTVSEYYGIVNQPTRYTDERYGWTNLDNARVVRVRDGYMIKLPRPFQLIRKRGKQQ